MLIEISINRTAILKALEGISKIIILGNGGSNAVTSHIFRIM